MLSPAPCNCTALHPRSSHVSKSEWSYKSSIAQYDGCSACRVLRCQREVPLLVQAVVCRVASFTPTEILKFSPTSIAKASGRSIGPSEHCRSGSLKTSALTHGGTPLLLVLPQPSTSVSTRYATITEIHFLRQRQNICREMSK